MQPILAESIATVKGHPEVLEKSLHDKDDTGFTFSREYVSKEYEKQYLRIYTVH